MRVLAFALGCATALGACGGAIAPEAGDGGSGSSSGSSGSSSGTIVGSSSGVTGSSSGTVSGSSSGFSSSSSSGSTSSTSSGGVVDAMTTGCANGAPPPTQSPACNQCIADFCEDTWCACAADSQVDAGNVEGCLGYVDCIIVCLDGDPEAGVPPADGGIQQCAMLCGTSYTPQEQQEGQALLSCLASSCATATTCGQ